ncbi:MAG: tRNA pseudouridine(55) synthase TruB [Opitutales bacterium]|nr:tRNA pseudouridine(55) synthase TruB [Opitutales bacterium]
MMDPTNPEGLLLVDKPTDFTSHDVIAKLRKKFQMKRIGHAGTLDPMATGLLLCLIGKATKASQYLISLNKEYEGSVTFGQVTNTQDAEGEVLASSPVPELSEDELQSHLRAFKGDQYQMPPMHSAIKIDGVPLYKMARKGQEVKREPRFIHISSFKLLAWNPPVMDFRVRCSKGTYVRTLAHDLGEKVGCGAHLSALRRTAIDELRVEDSMPLAELEALPRLELLARLRPVSQFLPLAAKT